jgi:sugar fermentation stimulation protein A
LIEAIFVERLNRFAVRVIIDDKTETAHLHDPGRLQELLIPGARLYLRKANRHNRKTGWDVILIKKGRQLVVIYSTLANQLLAHLLRERQFPGLRGWRLVRTEPPFGKGRFDFELARGKRRMFVEVKSVSLVENGIAKFPDAPTKRGRRHLEELADAVNQGYQAKVLFIVTRNDADSLQPNWKRDPEFGHTLNHVIRQGVKAIAFKCKIKRQAMALDCQIPIYPGEQIEKGR